MDRSVPRERVNRDKEEYDRNEKKLVNIMMERGFAHYNFDHCTVEFFSDSPFASQAEYDEYKLRHPAGTFHQLFPKCARKSGLDLERYMTMKYWDTLSNLCAGGRGCPPNRVRPIKPGEKNVLLAAWNGLGGVVFNEVE